MKQAPVKAPRVAPKSKQYQALLEGELARAQQRLRTLDIATAALLLLVGLATYTVVVMVLDTAVELPVWLRRSMLALAALGGACYAAVAMIRPLWYHVNPYFAARTLEHSAPESKNGIINWLDLREQPLNPVIRDAVQQRAAKELGQVDVEEAIPQRRPLQLLLTLGLLVAVLLGFALVLPDQFGSLFKRALLPFANTRIPTYTRLELVKPIPDPVSDDPQNAEPIEIPVEPGQPVAFGVLVHGVIPDQVLLDYQATLQERPLTKTLQRPPAESRGEPWTLTLASDAIPADGLWLRFRGGDGMTRPYRLIVSSRKPPSVSDLKITLKFPPYTKRRDLQQTYGTIRALVGTKVDLEVIADQPVKDGYLELAEVGEATNRAIHQIELVNLPSEGERASERHLYLKSPLELLSEYKPSNPANKLVYRLLMRNAENKLGKSPDYPLTIDTDKAPVVEMLRLGQHEIHPGQPPIHVPKNDILPIWGRAFDDVAVARVRLHLRTAEGMELRLLGGKPEESDLQKPTGFTPPQADFQLTLDLTKLGVGETDATARPYEPRPGDQLEVYVEASDPTQPNPQAGMSQVVRLILNDNQDEKQRQEKEKEAKKQEQEREQQKQEQQQRQQPQQNQQQPDQKDKDQKGQDQKGQDQKGQDQKGQDQKGQDQKGQDQKGQDQKGQDQKGQDQKGQDQKGQDQKGQDQKGQDQKGQDQKGQDQKGQDQKGQDQKGQDQKGQDQKGQDQKGQDQKGQDQKGQDQKGQDQKGQDQKGQDQKGQDQKGQDQKGQDQKGQNQKGQDQKGQDQKGQDQKGQDQKGQDQKGQDQKGQDQKGQDQKGQDQKGQDQKGQDQKGQDQKGQDQKGQDQKGQDQKGQDQKGQDQKGQDQKGQDQKGQDQKGQDQKGQDQKGQDQKGQDQKGQDQKGQDQKGQDQKGQDQKGQDQKGQDQKGQDQKGQDQKGQDQKGQDQKGQDQKGQDQKGQDQKGQDPMGDNTGKEPGEEGKGKADDEMKKQAEEVVKAAKRGKDDAGGERPGQRGEHLPEPDLADPNAAAKATDLTLESLREKLKQGKIDQQVQNVLNEMNWSETDLKKFLERYDASKNQGVAGQGPGRTIRVDRGVTKDRKGAELNANPGFDPPPELRGAYERFTERRAKASQQPVQPKRD
jgi:hypothetical protein